MVEINYCLNKDDAKLYHISQIGNRKNIFCPECNGELYAQYIIWKRYSGRIREEYAKKMKTTDALLRASMAK